MDEKLPGHYQHLLPSKSDRLFLINIFLMMPTSMKKKNHYSLARQSFLKARNTT